MTLINACTRFGRHAVMLLAVLLAGCNAVDLFTQLSERQANEMVASLQAVGIDGEKQTKDGTTWSVQVPKAAFGRAVDTLRAQGLPREEFDSLGRVFKKEGFVSSPLEERARLIYGLSQELSSTISSIDGVLVARVHLAVPEKDPLSDRPRPASASVMIKYRPGFDPGTSVGQIKALVVNAVEGLSYDNVTVTMFAAQESRVSPLSPVPAPARPLMSAQAGVLAYAAIALLAVGVLAWWAVRDRRGRRRKSLVRRRVA